MPATTGQFATVIGSLISVLQNVSGMPTIYFGRNKGFSSSTSYITYTVALKSNNGIYRCDNITFNIANASAVNALGIADLISANLLFTGDNWVPDIINSITSITNIVGTTGSVSYTDEEGIAHVVVSYDITYRA